MKKPSLSSTIDDPQPTPSRVGFVQTRAQNFGLTLVVMGASFALYYLGLFGTQDGPLNPARMGNTLNGLGFNSRHLLGVLVALLIASLIWNHLLNLIHYLRGSRMTCSAIAKLSGKNCGAPVRRIESAGINAKSKLKTYICPQGHRLTKAHFHRIRKGVWGHCAWMGCLTFVLITIYHL